MMDRANIDFERLRTILEAARMQRDRNARLSRTFDQRHRQVVEVRYRLESMRDGLRSSRDREQKLAPVEQELARAQKLKDMALDERAKAAAERPEVNRLATACAEYVYAEFGDRTPLDVLEFLGVA